MWEDLFVLERSLVPDKVFKLGIKSVVVQRTGDHIVFTNWSQRSAHITILIAGIFSHCVDQSEEKLIFKLWKLTTYPPEIKHYLITDISVATETNKNNNGRKFIHVALVELDSSLPDNFTW